MLEIKTIAVLGVSPGASRVALLASLARLDVRLWDQESEALDGAFKELRRTVEQALAEGRIGRDERQRILDGVLLTSDLEEAVVGADLVFADGATGPDGVRAFLARLATSCRATTLLATRLDPAVVAAGLPQPGRVVGLAVDEENGPFPRVAVRAGPGTTGHARERGQELMARLARAAGGHR